LSFEGFEEWTYFKGCYGFGVGAINGFGAGIGRTVGND